MSTGSRLTHITPPFGAPAGGRGRWGVQPSGPLIAIAGGNAARGSMFRSSAAAAVADTGPHVPAFLPKPSTLDYAHKFTITTLLLAGVAGVLLFGPRRPRAILKGLGKRQILPFGGR